MCTKQHGESLLNGFVILCNSRTEAVQQSIGFNRKSLQELDCVKRAAEQALTLKTTPLVTGTEETEIKSSLLLNRHSFMHQTQVCVWEYEMFEQVCVCVVWLYMACHTGGSASPRTGTESYVSIEEDSLRHVHFSSVPGLDSHQCWSLWKLCLSFWLKKIQSAEASVSRRTATSSGQLRSRQPGAELRFSITDWVFIHNQWMHHYTLKLVIFREKVFRVISELK